MKNVGIDFGIEKRRLGDFVFSSPRAIEFRLSSGKPEI
jgi:hypothetical protein